MRITVEHKTIYRFSVPQGRVTQLLRLTPSGTDGQAVANWGIHVDCDARMRHGRDGFGNRTTMLYVEGPIDGIEIEVSGEVLTNGTDGVLHGSIEPLPPAVYLRSTAADRAERRAGATFAADAVASATDAVERMHVLNTAFHQRFTLDRGKPLSGRSAAEAFELKTATLRDFAQMFTSGARGLGVPARYVSGLQLGLLHGRHAACAAWLGGGLYRWTGLGCLRSLHRAVGGRCLCAGRGGAGFRWCRPGRRIAAGRRP